MFVVALAGMQAVVKLAEEFVEQVPLGLVVPISGGAAGIVMPAGARGNAQGGQRPDWADGGQPPVFDVPMQHNGFLAAGAGDRGSTGEGLQPAGVSEAGAVVADLGHAVALPGAGRNFPVAFPGLKSGLTSLFLPEAGVNCSFVPPQPSGSRNSKDGPARLPVGRQLSI